MREGGAVAWSLVSPALSGGLWLPAASPSAERFDSLFLFIFGIAAFFFLLVVGTMVVFVIRYRRRSPSQKTADIHGNKTIEIVWAAIPAAILMVIFVRGFTDYLDLAVAPRDAIEVRVTAQ